MIFIRKIYFDNKPLILTNAAKTYIADQPAAGGYPLLQGASARNFRLARKQLESPQCTGILLEDHSETALLSGLRAAFVPSVAGGGVVSAPRGATLMIYRHGKWDLPKGKQDDGESIEICARREVMEETGLPEVRVSSKICETYHVYTFGDTDFLKITHWFRMSADTLFPLYPQKAENITEARWVADEELEAYASGSYETIKEVLSASGKIVTGQM